MTLQYQEVFNKFLLKITDYSFLEYDEEFINDNMKGWMFSVASIPYLRAKFATLSFDDEDGTIDFQLKRSVDNDSDIYFVTDIFAKGMVAEWLEPQVKNVLYTKQFFGGKEEKFYSQAAMLKELRDLLNDVKIDLRKTIRDYGYINNSYLGDY